jgi:signal transduction histidine kinase
MMVELEQTNQDLKAFAEIVSHDLKAPLYAMSSLMQQLRLNASHRLTLGESEIIDLILEEVSGMGSLIEGVLSYSRLSFDGDEKVQVDFNELVAHIIRIIAPQPHIRITVADPLPTLTVDSTKMSQVFLNLLSNAVNYNDKASGVIIVRCVQSDRGWLFSIADNGRGIDTKDFPLVFQMFKGSSAAPRGRSSGMGLPFVKKIVESYGGHVWFTSQIGVGSVFYFRLPIMN